MQIFSILRGKNRKLRSSDICIVRSGQDLPRYCFRTGGESPIVLSSSGRCSGS
jgi:hypothetical protein